MLTTNIQTDPSKPNAASGVWALPGLSMATLLASLGTSIANTALPTLTLAFDASFQDVQWTVLGYLLAITTLIVSAGRLGDAIGRRRLFLAGIGIFTAASILCGLSFSLWMLTACRVAQGAGAAVMMALAMAFVRVAVVKEKTGGAMGLLGTMSAVGTALGPSLGGVLIAGFGWRAIFLAKVPLGILSFVLAYRYLPLDGEVKQTEGQSFDVAGTLLLIVTLTAYALAMTMGRGTFGSLNAALLFAAAISMALFILIELRAKSPLVRMSMFRDRALSSGFAMSALVTTVVMATLVVGPFYLSGALGLGVAGVGMLMSAGPVVAALTGVPAGYFADRFGAGPITVAGLVAMFAGSAGMSALPTSLGVPGYVVPIVIITAGYALFQAANNTAVMRDVDAGERGVVSGILSLSRNLGLISGASAMGAIFAAASATDVAGGQPEAVAAGMQITFAIAALLIGAAIVISVAGRSGSRRDPEAVRRSALARG